MLVASRLRSKKMLEFGPLMVAFAAAAAAINFLATVAELRRRTADEAPGPIPHKP